MDGRRFFLRALAGGLGSAWMVQAAEGAGEPAAGEPAAPAATPEPGGPASKTPRIPDLAALVAKNFRGRG